MAVEGALFPSLSAFAYDTDKQRVKFIEEEEVCTWMSRDFVQILIC